LNHTRGGKWTDPPIEEALQAVAEAGYTRVVYYPYGFLADNAESELEGRVALAALEGVDSKHLPCLNESPALARAIATLVVESAGKSAAPAA
jgi:protoheme ferro-lyase